MGYMLEVHTKDSYADTGKSLQNSAAAILM